VDQDGLVTAVGPGTATITVTTADGGFTADCVITVNPSFCTVTLYDVNGYTLTPNPTDGPVQVPYGNSFEFSLLPNSLLDSTKDIREVTTSGSDPVRYVGYTAGVGYQYVIDSVTSDQEVSITISPTIQSSSSLIGSSVTITGTVDPSVGASYVKIYVTLRDGSTQSFSSGLTSNGKFEVIYSGIGLNPPISYKIVAYDGLLSDLSTSMVTLTGDIPILPSVL